MAFRSGFEPMFPHREAKRPSPNTTSSVYADMIRYVPFLDERNNVYMRGNLYDMVFFSASRISFIQSKTPITSTTPLYSG